MVTTIHITGTNIAPMQVEILRLRNIITNKDIYKLYSKFNNIHVFSKVVLDWCGIGPRTLTKMLYLINLELPKEKENK